MALQGLYEPLARRDFSAPLGRELVPVIERFDVRCSLGNPMREAFRNHHLTLYSIAVDVIGPAQSDAPRVIVDAACGMGHGFVFLGGLGHYIGLDRSPDALSASRRRYPAGEFRHADFADSRWLRGIRPDVVVSLETAEHLDDPESFLRRIALALPRDGLFIFSVPTCLTRDFDPWHKWDFPANIWHEMLTEAGFRIERQRAFSLEGSFRQFLATVPTTWWQKARVVLFDLFHPSYALDRILGWILQDRFIWTSTLFICRPVYAKAAQAMRSRLKIEAET